jgi:hypothetical protein
VRVEELAIALRSRQGWEAIDLGFRMAAHWARPLWTIWLVIYVPLAGALLVALQGEPLLAALAIWWLLPVAERFVMYVLSRRVFGDPAPLAATLAAWRSVLTPGLGRLLLLRPLGWDRAFLQPIPLLERQRGAAARRRAGVLGRRLGGHAMALAWVCLCFEGVVMLAVVLFATLLTPAAEVGGAGASSGLAEALGLEWWGMGATLAYALALALVEPFYIAAGFAMYLVRRTQLEGWDIELALRRAAVEPAPAARSRPPPLAPLTMLLLALLVPAAAPLRAAEVEVEADVDSPALGVPVSKRAILGEPALPLAPPEPLDSAARRAALAVLEDDDFGRSVERLRWRLDFGDERKPDADTDLDWLADVGEWVAVGLRIMAWLALATLGVAVVWLLARRLGGASGKAVVEKPPARLFGLAISPDSLPDDVVAAAMAAIDAGRLRDALSLLYRGALSYLVHQCGMRIGEGATEGEVLRMAQPLLAGAANLHFGKLVAAWVEIAYGHRAADADVLRAMCVEQRRHFAAGASAGASPPPPLPTMAPA